MEFQVVASTLNEASASCVSTNESIQAGVAQMQNYVAGLMAVYTGTAAQALMTLSEQWGSDAKTLNHVLLTISEGLKSNAVNYVNFEQTNTVNYTNIIGGLPPARF
jgi:WXG100 family type VII secretion target